MKYSAADAFEMAVSCATDTQQLDRFERREVAEILHAIAHNAAAGRTLLVVNSISSRVISDLESRGFDVTYSQTSSRWFVSWSRGTRAD